MHWVINMKRLVSSVVFLTRASATISTTTSVVKLVIVPVLALGLSLTTNAAEAVVSKSLTHANQHS